MPETSETTLLSIILHRNQFRHIDLIYTAKIELYTCDVAFTIEFGCVLERLAHTSKPHMAVAVYLIENSFAG